MVRCHNCGLLTIWNSVDLVLLEAPEHFRKEGELLNHHNSMNTCAPKCFIRKADLEREILIDPQLKQLFNLKEGIRRVIQQERLCDGFTPWLQGFHPKEHKEMLLNEQMLATQRRQANISLGIACFTALASVVSIGISAYFTQSSARLGAEAAIEAVRLQIKSDKEIAQQSQPINVTVNIPEVKKPSEKPTKK